MEKYYKAYDKRYKQVHKNNLSWSSNNNTKIIYDIINKYNINKEDKILEIGCGEGRDARYLLKKGYNVLATDVSEESIRYCQEQDKVNSDNYKVLDVITSNNFNYNFDFIYSVACLHMLITEGDRNSYYKFIYNNLSSNGIAVILSMGDGIIESTTKEEDAWKDTIRIHQETNQEMLIASTSCKMVNFQNFFEEIKNNHFEVLEHGVTEIIPDFKEIMYAVIKKR